jgi:hypothetical protein
MVGCFKGLDGGLPQGARSVSFVDTTLEQVQEDNASLEAPTQISYRHTENHVYWAMPVHPCNTVGCFHAQRSQLTSSVTALYAL